MPSFASDVTPGKTSVRAAVDALRAGLEQAHAEDILAAIRKAHEHLEAARHALATPLPDEPWRFHEDRRRVLYMNPAQPGHGYVHEKGMGAALMAMRGERVDQEPLETVAARLDAEGWLPLVVDVRPVGHVNNSALALRVEKAP